VRGNTEAAAELAFLPRSIARRLTSSAQSGASAEELLEAAASIDPHRSWRPSVRALRAERDALASGHVRLIVLGERGYPALLREIHEPPLCIHVRGSLPEDGRAAVAIVGSRSSGPNALGFAEQLSRELAEAGVAVVSGMARGIDSAAHRGCILGGGVTVAVLGCGVDICYPRENRGLMDSILERGGVVSEYPVGTPPAPYRFPERNRIVSGLCSAVVVVEGRRDSGALVTARLATDQNRSVLAVPGAVWNPLSEGPNDLIRDGAALVRSADDVLEETVGLLARPRRREAASSTELGQEGRAVLSVLDYDEPRHLDEVAAAAGLGAARAVSVLLHLEVVGLVRELGGKRYVRASGGS